MDIELIAQYHCQTGEGPLWHPERRLLYWVDIPAGRLFQYEPHTGQHRLVHEGRPIGGFTFQTNGGMLLFRDKGRVEELRDETVARVVIDHVPGEEHQRWNDVAAAPDGSVFGGTMAAKHPDTGQRLSGRFCRLTTDGKLHVIEHEIGCSNGIGWSPDLSKMYYIDTPRGEIWAYDYDRATGDVANRQTFVKVDGPGGPDGMTVDAEGGVWCAKWGGGCIKHYDSDGKLVRTIDVPARNVTSVTFGGDNLDELYITTAAAGDPDGDPATSGALFRCRPGVRGRPEFESRVLL